MSRRRGVAFAMAAAMVAAILAGCAHGSAESLSPAGGITKFTEGLNGPPCTAGAIQSAAEQEFSQSGGSIQGIQQFHCSGSFAYAFADVNAQGNVNSVTLLFKASGTSWVPADRATYCADGAVPANIYADACETQ